MKQPATEQEWKQKLTPQQHHVLRQRGTEQPFTGKLLYNKEQGIYTCAGCGARIFSSAAKFDSGTGWPSFSDALKGKIMLQDDFSRGIKRMEVSCKSCGGHLGHLFADGPKPTGKRYCINSEALEFRGKKKVLYA